VIAGGEKIAGFCTAGCGTACYEILSTGSDGRPHQLGDQLPNGTQIEFQLSDGSEVAITFCHECAVALTAADYPAVWRVCVEAMRSSLTRAGRRDSEIRAGVAALARLWIVGRLRRRRESPEPGLLMVDRR
jgi:hypothetical protein